MSAARRSASAVSASSRMTSSTFGASAARRRDLELLDARSGPGKCWCAGTSARARRAAAAAPTCALISRPNSLTCAGPVRRRGRTIRRSGSTCRRRWGRSGRGSRLAALRCRPPSRAKKPPIPARQFDPLDRVAVTAWPFAPPPTALDERHRAPPAADSDDDQDDTDDAPASAR